MAKFGITVSDRNGANAVVKLAGAMETADLTRMEDEFNKLFEAGVTALAVNVAELESLTSAGFGSIVNLSRILRTRKGRFAITSGRPEFLELIELLGLQDEFDLAENMGGAR
ncbi:MAG: STAS domain-containing protein [Planctomycetota bacterium]|jgi:anti-anti-sigma factor|nr:STAS domain-containing protein [Planctomycetota bacterium]